ncbi:12524_t:CDS:2 [Ambispora gerdemannii]|uniref:12524_t:CDS:1 n=1 Tax=Ambispora gerdemannii TaxID=144530 RepID=A0A9N9CUV3_9GLOM|nr:12524_t:CDS:2 [Ambispora gerdemannii]
MFPFNKFQPQRTLTQEPSFFLLLRVIIAFSVILLWLTYVYFLVVQILTDHPVIELAYRFEELIEAPDMEICAEGTMLEFRDCLIEYPDDRSHTYTNCAREDGTLYITQGEYQTDNMYCYLFSGNGTLFYGNTTDGIWKIVIYYTMIDINYEDSDINEIASIDAQLLDPNSNSWEDNLKVRNKLDEAVIKDINLQGSAFAGLNNYSTIIKFKQNTYRSIAQNDLKSYFGFAGQYDETIIMPSTITYHPLKRNPKFNKKRFSGDLSIEVATYIHEIYTERRIRTLLNSLGVAGGIIGFFAAFYYFLFGDKRIKPWGFMHRIFSSQIEQSTNDKLVLSSDEQAETYERRLIYLEGLISDFILNTQPLKKVKKTLVGEENSIY